MGSDINLVQFVVDQIEPRLNVTFKKMFGEYALYSNGKVVALICDDQLFVKITNAGRSFVKDAKEATAYKGAKPSFLIEDQIEDRDWLSKLIEITEKDLPKPKPKKRKNT